MVDRAKGNVQIAELERLYRQKHSAFVQIAASITGNRDIGWEAVQEAFTRAIARVETFRGDCPLEAWVWRIVVNASRTAAQRSSRPNEDLGAEVDQLAELNGHREPSSVLTWVRSLPERQRTVVFLRYWADLDYRAIAIALDIEVGTVSATLNKAHRALRDALEEVS